jgi:capsid protein
MKFLQKLFSGKVGKVSRPAVRATNKAFASANGFHDYYDGISGGRLYSRIRHNVANASDTANEWTRHELMSVARYLFENDGIVKGAITDLARYSFPLKPQANTTNPDWNREAEEYFADWSTYATLDGRHSFEDVQRLASIAIDRDGDIGVVYANRPGKICLQLLEAHRIRNPKDAAANWHDGVRLDRTGTPTAYSVTQGEGYRTINAATMMLLADPERCSQVRGLTALRHALAHIRDKKDILGFEKTGVKNLSSISAVLETENGDADPDAWDISTETAGAASGSDLHLTNIQSGAIPVLRKGEKFNAFQGNRPSNTFTGFLEFLLREFAVGLGLPYEFLWNPEKLTGTSQRFILGKASRRFKERQRLFAPFIKRTWAAVISDGIMRGKLGMIEGWEKIIIQAPQSLTVDAGRDANAEREDMKAGLLTMREHYGKRGLDWQEEIEQGAQEIEFLIGKAREVADRTGAPLSTVLNRMSLLTPNGEPINQATEE